MISKNWYDSITKMELNFESVKKVSLSRSVAEKIIGYIKEGYLKVGDKLPPERTLCEKFQVSRTSLREGIKALTHLGILESIPGSGVYVRTGFPRKVLQRRLEEFKINEATISNLIEFREGIESFIGELAAKRATGEEINELEKTIIKMEKKKEKGVSFAKEEAEFHKILARASHNDFFVKVLDSIVPSILRWVYARELVIDPDRAISLHKSILESIKKRDREETKKAIKTHFAHARELIKKITPEDQVK